VSVAWPGHCHPGYRPALVSAVRPPAVGLFLRSLIILANYAWIVRRSAATTAMASTVLLAIYAAVGGVKGLLAGLFALALVTAFFGIDQAVVGRVARLSPAVVMAAALAIYLVKMLLLLILIARFGDPTVINAHLFGIAAIALVLVYSAALMIWSIRLKAPFAEVDGTGRE
jgi:ATP synthase protein I